MIRGYFRPLVTIGKGTVLFREEKSMTCHEIQERMSRPVNLTVPSRSTEYKSLRYGSEHQYAYTGNFRYYKQRTGKSAAHLGILPKS